MIPRLICWLFGHKIRGVERHVDEYLIATDVYIWLERCPRCGARLKEE